MQNNKAGESGGLNIHQLQYTAMNVVENFCSVICRPVELILRPFHGSRYFPVPVIFFSTAMMILLPIFSVLTTTAVSMIPFAHALRPRGCSTSGPSPNSTSCWRSPTGYAFTGE